MELKNYLSITILVTFLGCTFDSSNNYNLDSGLDLNTNNLEAALLESGSNRNELEKVLNYYEKRGDKKRLEAAKFLISNLPGQFHFVGSREDEFYHSFKKMNYIMNHDSSKYFPDVWDSLESQISIRKDLKLRKVDDINVIKSEFLIENIETSFEAWNYPWAKKLTFEEFCHYLLPYKLKNERPTLWKSKIQKKYDWLSDSSNNTTDLMKVCTLINNDLKKWFYFASLDCGYDVSYDDLDLLKMGKCPEQVQMTTYIMRALGVPVSIEMVIWANRNAGHYWNALHYGQKVVPFLGTELNPGVYKLEFAYPGSLESKRPKIWRRAFSTSNSHIITPQESGLFSDNRWIDVTNDYVNTVDIELQINEELDGRTAYICVFNNLGWRPIHWTKIKNQKAIFDNLGVGIVYICAVKNNSGNLEFCSMPFLVNENSTTKIISASKSDKEKITLYRKYPTEDDNKIFSGFEYELFYWDDKKWNSISKQLSLTDSLVFDRVPAEALLWLRNLDEGKQERIFTIDKGNIKWW